MERRGFLKFIISTVGAGAVAKNLPPVVKKPETKPLKTISSTISAPFCVSYSCAVPMTFYENEILKQKIRNF